MSEATEPLPLPRTVNRSRVLWIYAIPIALVHLMAMTAAVPWLFSWTGVILMVLGVHVFGQGINIGYHRLLAHRSFRVPTWVERGFVVLALCCMQDTPARWVTDHRYHHKKSDTQPDPHSPLVNFFWSHVGWLMFHNGETHHYSAYRAYAPDILRDSFYMALAKRPVLAFYIYLAHAALFFGTGFAVGYATAPAGSGAAMAGLQFGSSLLVWGVILRTVVVWHITWAVNSLTHLFGYRNYETDENSKNNWFVALVTVGEGWHNNHHYDPASSSNQHRWWEFDISYYEIKLLEWLGLATKVNPPRHQRRLNREARNRGSEADVQADADAAS